MEEKISAEGAGRQEQEQQAASSSAQASVKKKVPFEGARRGGNTWYLPPEAFLRIEDENHSLYDVRAFEAPPESMIRSVMKRGIKKPILVTKRFGDGQGPVVVDGRKRIQCALIGNKRLRDAGAAELELIQVPFRIEEGDEAELCQIMVETNEQHVEDSILNKAAKAVRLLNLGRTKKEVADAFGLKSTNAIDDWRKLLSLDQKVIDAVRKDKLAPHAAISLHGLPEEAQRETLAELLAQTQAAPADKKSSGRKPRPTAARAKKLVKEKGGKPKGKEKGFIWRSRTEINEEISILQKAVKSERNKDRLNALLWVRGEDL